MQPTALKNTLFLLLLLISIAGCRKVEPTGIVLSDTFIDLQVGQRDTIYLTLLPQDASSNTGIMRRDNNPNSIICRNLESSLIVEVTALQIDTTILSFRTGKNLQIESLCTLAIVAPPILSLAK